MPQIMRPMGIWINACAACLLFMLPQSSSGSDDSTASAVRFVRRFTVEEKDQPILCICFASDGSKVIAGTASGIIWVWDVGDEKSAPRKIRGASDELLAGGVQCIACSPDGKRLLAGGGDGLVRLVDLETCRIIRTLKGNGSAAFAVAFTKDGRRGLSGNARTYRKGAYNFPIFLWDLEEGKEIYHVQGDDRPTCLEVSPDQKTFLSVEGRINLRDLSTGKVIRSFEDSRFRIMGAHFIEDGAEIISSCMDEPFRIWDVKTGKCKHNFPLEDYYAESMAVYPKSQLVLLGAAGGARLWNLAGKELHHWDKLVGKVAVAFSPDGCFGLIADQWGSVQLWQLRKPAGKGD